MSRGVARSRSGTQWLIRLAARNAPEALSQRLEEEWLAHLGACRSGWSALCLALGCCWASALISRPRGDAKTGRPAPASTSLAMPGSAIRFGEPHLRYFSLRPGTLFLIVELQAALLCGLVLPL